MTFLKLTDFFGNGTELVALRDVVRVEPYVDDIELEEEYSYQTFWTGKVINDTRIVLEEHLGSTVVLANGEETHVLETPDEIHALIEQAENENSSRNLSQTVDGISVTKEEG